MNDFDISCTDFETQAVTRRVGTEKFWSPRFDNDCAKTYDKDDDWFGLALTFAYWLGLYSGIQSPVDNMTVKLYTVRMLLSLHDTPAALKARINPSFSRIEKELNGDGP